MNKRLKNWTIIRKGISILLLLGVLTFGAVGDSWSGISAWAIAPALQCKVMPLGDSITVGSSSGVDDLSKQISFRKDLWDSLSASGYVVDFVGSQTNGEFYSGFDPDHEGHGGWSDAAIAFNIYDNGGENFLIQNPPDIILLHIGTNAPRSPSEVEHILDEIDDYQVDAGSKVIVIIARIIGKVSNSAAFFDFNNSVESIVTARSDYGSELFMVDMENGAGLNYSIYPGDPAGDMFDDLHPYATGYTKMANVWYAKFNEVFSSAVSNNAPVVTNPGTQTDSEDSLASLQIIASDVDAITYAAYNLPPGLSINSLGMISGTIDISASNGSPYDVHVVVADGNLCGSSSVSFTWNVSGVNFPPEIDKPVANQDDVEGDSVSLQITATDPNGDILTYSATGLPGGLSIDQSGLISGEINYLASNGLPYSVKVTVVDDGIPAESDFVDFTWTVTNKNGPPIISPVSDQEHLEGTTINPPLVVNAVDPDGDGFQFQAANLPPGLQIDADSGEISGTIAYHAVTSGSSKDYLVEIVASDDQDPANSSSELFVWRVNNVSGPPVVINPGDQRNRIGDDVSLQIQASDPDGDDISFSAENLPPNLEIHQATGLITGEIAEYAILNNPFSVTVTVKDDLELPHGTIQFDWMISRGEIYFPLVIH